MMVGKNLKHYEIVSELGRGGMGEVYRARDTKLGREVAIKVLPAEFSQDQERLARLEREARMLAALNHPNIAAIHGLEESDDTRFLVLELVEGDTLADKLKTGPIKVADSLKLALQIAEALEAAHEKGVIHRDLKPANIKVTPEGRVKVLDFGLAKAFIGDPADVNLSNSPTLSMQATQAGIILGTAAYMSPEQARGREIDTRTDVWAFGCVLYEMLGGSSAFAGDDVSLTLARVLERQPDFSLLPPNLHPRIRFLLERCLEKEARDRCQGIAEARTEIHKVLADPGGLIAQPAAEIAQPAQQSKLPWVAALVAGVFIAGVGGWTLKPADPQPVLRSEFVLPDGLNFRNIARPALSLSPDGRQFVYNAFGGVYVRSLNELDSRLISGTEGTLTNPTFSPDGEWLVYWSGADQQLKKIAVVGGAPVNLASVSANPFGISWDEADWILYSDAEGIQRVSANGGEPDLLIGHLGEYARGFPQLLPDGEAVLFGTSTGQVGIHALDSGESELLFPGGRPRYVATGHIVYLQDGVLFAVPFDRGSLEVTGGPVSMAEGIQSLQYAVSDSGSLISIPGTAAPPDPDKILARVDRAGAVEPLPIPPRPYVHVRVSPDGNQAALEAIGPENNEIWIYDLDGNTQMRQLTGEGNNTSPIWTPDGERLTFASDRDGSVRVYWQAADLTGVAVPLTPAGDDRAHEPDSWSADGRTLSFSKLLPAPRSVWTVDVDENGEPGEAELLETGSDTQGSAFSPDGGWIAYRKNTPSSDGPNTEDIYMQPFPATGTELRLTQNGGSYPMWSRTGQELFYRPGLIAMQARGVEPQLQFVEMTLDPTPVWGSEQSVPLTGFQPVVGRRDYDIMPDGESFIMALPAGEDESVEADRPRIHIVVNWFTELRERVPVD